MTKANVVVLPGDGIGPEVVAEGRRVLERVAARFGHEVTFSEHLIGGAAIDAKGDPLPKETLAACEQADAVLLGAVLRALRRGRSVGRAVARGRVWRRSQADERQQCAQPVRRN